MYPALFVLDMIGTTVMPSDAIPQAFRDALAEAGITLTDAQISSVRGKSKREAIAELLRADAGDSDRDRVYESFKSRLERYYRSGGARPIDGALDVFEWCRSIGAKVALTTGFDSDIVALLIEGLGWSREVDAVVCNDDVPKGRPAPFLIQRAMESLGVDHPRSVANIGDTVSDLRAGNNASVGWNFAVLSGAHDEKTLLTVANATILPSVASLPGYDWNSC